MALLDLLELGELFLSWRLYVGLAVTVTLAVAALSFVPLDTPGWVAWAVCVPIGLVGIILSSVGKMSSASRKLAMAAGIHRQLLDSSFKPTPLRAAAQSQGRASREEYQ